LDSEEVLSESVATELDSEEVLSQSVVPELNSEEPPTSRDSGKAD
jgi:hypothetical protein